MPKLRPRSLATGLALAIATSFLTIVASSTPATAAGECVGPAASGSAAKPTFRGTPPTNVGTASGTYFSFPNRSTTERMNIRNRVLNEINSTWGVIDYAPRCNYASRPNLITNWVVSERGSIKIATWSFNDQSIAYALRNAAVRGASVQLVAAQGVNAENNYKPWKYIKNALNNYRAPRYGDPASTNFAAECSGSCRGYGGTPHSKFFLFDQVGTAAKYRKITFQTSMNLTAFAYNGQWNQAVVYNDETRNGSTAHQAIYDRFAQIHNGMAYKIRSGYQNTTEGGVNNIFFPGGSATRDPMINALNATSCSGATRGRTKVRVINYAIYDNRGVAIAKRLRSLWNAGCDVAVIYGVTSKPVLQVLRASSGRGPVPMRQSVIKNRAGDIVKYNHSKWIAIAGNYAGNPNANTVLSGSSNFSDFAYSCDEQTQQFFAASWTGNFFRNFDTTWSQSSSKPPSSSRFGGTIDGARVAMAARSGANPHTFGYGEFKYMDND